MIGEIQDFDTQDLINRWNARIHQLRQEIGNSGLTVQETIVMEFLVAAWNAYVEINSSEYHDREFSEGLHKCQGVLMARILHRLYPDYWVG